jgi:hypothetical protein
LLFEKASPILWFCGTVDQQPHPEAPPPKGGFLGMNPVAANKNISSLKAVLPIVLLNFTDVCLFEKLHNEFIFFLEFFTKT